MLGLNAIAALPLGDARGVPYVMSVTHGTYALSMQGAAKLITDIYPSGTFTLDGRAVDFNVGYYFDAQSGSFAVTGQDVAFSIGKGIVFDTGTFTQTVYDVEFPVSLSPDAEVGEFTLSGQSVAFEIHVSIAAESGTFAVTGQDIPKTISEIAGPVNFVTTRNDIEFTVQRSFVLANGAYTIEGLAVKFRGFFSPYVPPEIWTEVA
jgi:hypothetical protein